MKKLKSGFRSRFSAADTEIQVAYIIGIGMFIAFIVVMILLQSDKVINYLLFSGKVCSFRSATGFYCPGCGGTRSLVMLSRGKIIESFKYHALVPVAAAMYFTFMITESLHLFLGTKGMKNRQFYIMLTIFVVILIVRWIAVNVLLIMNAV